MPQLFPRGANGAARFLLWGVVVALVVTAAVWIFFTRSGFSTGVGRFVEQPVPFSHQQHPFRHGILPRLSALALFVWLLILFALTLAGRQRLTFP